MTFKKSLLIYKQIKNSSSIKIINTNLFYFRDKPNYNMKNEICVKA